ncbi:MAG: hypothetical protein AAGD96_30390 [Chloroflexota bacterium]
MTNQKNTSSDPIERLYELLLEAREIVRTTNQPNAQQLVVWTKIFGSKSSDIHSNTYLTRSRAFIDLIERSENQVRKFEGVNLDIYLRPFKEVNKLIPYLYKPNAKQGMFNSIITGAVMNGLEYAVDQSKRQYPEPEKFEYSRLKEIGDEVISLRNEILESNLPQSLKEVLVRNLHKIDEAISLFFLKGIEGIDDALSSNWGILFRTVRQVSATEGGVNVAQRILKILNDIETIFSLDDRIGLSDLVVKMIGDGS